ncbi:MAG: hypothetical protein Q8Q49_05900 [bacterium]|nr:hypothetical protein [bacterium]
MEALSPAVTTDQLTKPTREPLIVQFDMPFDLPEDINLDPDNEDKILDANDNGTIVDVVDFRVDNSYLTGDIQVIHADTNFEDHNMPVRRSGGPTGPYTFDANFYRVFYHDPEYRMEMVRGGDIFFSEMEADHMNKDTGEWEAFSQSWHEPQSKGYVIPLFKVGDFPRFVLRQQSVLVTPAE